MALALAQFVSQHFMPNHADLIHSQHPFLQFAGGLRETLSLLDLVADVAQFSTEIWLTFWAQRPGNRGNHRPTASPRLPRIPQTQTRQLPFPKLNIVQSQSQAMTLAPAFPSVVLTLPAHRLFVQISTFLHDRQHPSSSAPQPAPARTYGQG